MTEVCGEPNR